MPNTSNPSGSHAREVELKLVVAPEDLERALRSPVVDAIAEGEAVVHDLSTTYYDTPDLDLAHASIALRLRDDGKTRVQTVKTLTDDAPGDSAAVSVRREWNWVVAGDEPDLSLIGPVVPISGDVRARLKPLFTTSFRRTTRRVRPDSRTFVEVAIDDGRTCAGDVCERVAEVELELLEGRMGRLFRLALNLSEDVPVRIATENKAEVGYRLVTGRAPKAAEPEPVALSPLSTAAEAFRHVIRHGVRRVLANEAAAVAGDEEAKRHIRAAARRLRTAFKLFRPLIVGPETESLQRDIRAVGDELGRRGDAAGVLRSPAFSRLILALCAWLEEDEWYAASPSRSELDKPMIASSSAMLDEALVRVNRAARDLEAGDDGDSDEIRRRARRLFHAVEFFRGLYPPAAVRPYVAALEALGGALNRAREARLARRALGLSAAERARLEGVIRQARDDIASAWAALTATKPFWI